MIIFGTKTFPKMKGLKKEITVCNVCGEESRWQLWRIASWFTLFFIPVFPYYIKQILICPICNSNEIKITSKNKDNLLPQIEEINN